jgi:DNA-binding MarR family transcriptional regulator
LLLEGNTKKLASDLLCKRIVYYEYPGYSVISSMKGTQLGEFEELVLLTVAFLYDEAYSVAVMEELSRRTERPMALGIVHRTMQRLEEKGLVVSRFGEATAERGGRRKRLFTVTTSGERALVEARRIRNELWADIAKAAFGGGLA